MSLLWRQAGWTGERRAVALLVLGFYTTIFFLVALAQGGAWLKCFLAMSLTYGLAFFALAAEWFWARWFAMGLGVSGLTLAGLGLITTGFNWGLVMWGVLHGLVYLPLVGDSMADRYENQQAWRKRYNLDEYGVARLKRAVRGAATALPTMIFYTLAPRQDQAAAVALLALVGCGIFGLVRMRFWGVALLGLAGVWTVISALFWIPTGVEAHAMPWALPTLGMAAAIALFAAIAPFIRPAYRYLRS